MNRKQLADIYRQQTSLCEKTLFRKSDEYATDKSALHNFETAARLTGQTPAQALGGMMVKHTVSVYDMIREGVENFTPEQWDEKITDHINYLILLKAIVAEEGKDLSAPALFSTDEILMNAPNPYNKI